MDAKVKTQGIIVKAGYISRKIDTPREFYSARTFYTTMFLTKGINLWYSNPIKSEVIPRFNLDKKILSDEARLSGLIDGETSNLLSEVMQYVSSRYGDDYDTLNLLMAIAIERVLKGLLLYNGYTIHKNKKSRISIKIDNLNQRDYKMLENKVYSLDNFTKFDILKHTIFWDSEKSLPETMKVIEHLKLLRDLEAHTAQGIGRLFQLLDIIAIVRVNEIMDKALEIHKIAHNNLEDLRRENKSAEPSVLKVGKSTIFNADKNDNQNVQGEDILKLLYYKNGEEK